MFGRKGIELEEPPLSRDAGAFEILRVWGGDNLPQQYSLKTVRDDPGAWGLMLVDIARHVAKAYGNTGDFSEEAALKRIKELFDAEWASPTDTPLQVK
ncbi:DUF5076 domain-containing protein [Dechloromonas sp. CZR5]|uniref:DUF5076 domain-containing protein n=1 Tax=Dechloromonas sp. CZR5 TaxID=2608630 RepID=UPI00123D0FBE|nr:DUF5076 domain-containing protein [Dechloromonas sp. CZR5]